MVLPETATTQRSMSTNKPAHALYMVWDATAARASGPIAAGYEVLPVPDEHVDAMRAVVELDGEVTTAQWSDFVDRVLPNGSFIARVVESREDVGTVSAIHNPRGARFFFPVPFLHAPDPNARAERWRNIFDAIGLASNEERWPRTLPNSG